MKQFHWVSERKGANLNYFEMRRGYNSKHKGNIQPLGWLSWLSV